MFFFTFVFLEGANFFLSGGLLIKKHSLVQLILSQNYPDDPVR